MLGRATVDIGTDIAQRKESDIYSTWEIRGSFLEMVLQYGDSVAG